MSLMGKAWSGNAQYWKREMASIKGSAFIFVLSLPVGGVLLAYESPGGHGIIISFFAGLLTSAFYLIAIFGTLFSIGFFGGVVSHFNSLKEEAERQPYGNKPSRRGDAIPILFGLIMTSLWLVPLTWLLHQVPVVSEQITFMLRD